MLPKTSNQTHTPACTLGSGNTNRKEACSLCRVPISRALAIACGSGLVDVYRARPHGALTGDMRDLRLMIKILPDIYEKSRNYVKYNMYDVMQGLYHQQ